MFQPNIVAQHWNYLEKKIMSDTNKKKEEPTIFVEQPGTIGSNENTAAAVPVNEAKVEAEAETKLEEEETDAAKDSLKKEDHTGEAG